MMDNGYVQVVHIFFYRFVTFLDHFVFGLKCPKIRRKQPEKTKKAQSKWKYALLSRNHSWLRPHALFSLQWTSPYTIKSFKPPPSTIWRHFMPKKPQNGLKGTFSLTLGHFGVCGLKEKPKMVQSVGLIACMGYGTIHCNGKSVWGHNKEWFLAWKPHFNLLWAILGGLCPKMGL